MIKEKNTWRYWINPEAKPMSGFYYEFKSFKVYSAYRLDERESLRNKSLSTAFEQYLHDNGYIPHIYNHKKQIYEPGYSYYSTMGVIAHNFVNKDDPEKQIFFGLHEANRPPTLIWPRPNAIVLRDGKEHTAYYDDDMNVLLAKFKPEQILEAIFDKSIVLKCNADMIPNHDPEEEKQNRKLDLLLVLFMLILLIIVLGIGLPIISLFYFLLFN